MHDELAAIATELEETAHYAIDPAFKEELHKHPLVQFSLHHARAGFAHALHVYSLYIQLQEQYAKGRSFVAYINIAYLESELRELGYITKIDDKRVILEAMEKVKPV